MRRHHIEEAQAYLESLGIKATIKKGKKHPKLLFSFEGRDHSVTMSSTPRDSLFAGVKAMADIRRILKGRR